MDELRPKIIRALSRVQVHDIDPLGEAVIEIEADKIIELIRQDRRERGSMNLTPDEMLLAENKRLKEAGDALYERASYTGRTFDGTHRLLSAAAHWLDVRGKNSGEYQAGQRLTGLEDKLQQAIEQILDEYAGKYKPREYSDKLLALIRQDRRELLERLKVNTEYVATLETPLMFDIPAVQTYWIDSELGKLQHGAGVEEEADHE